MKLYFGTITSSPAFTPLNIKEICNAAVQFVVATAYLAPVTLQTSFSKALTLFPPEEIQPDL